MDRRHSYASLASTSGTRRRPLPPTPRGPRVPTRLPSAPSPAPSIPAPNAPPSYASVHTPSADAKPRRHSGKPLAWPPEKHESLEHDMLPVYTPRPQSVSVEKKAPVELPPEEVHDITAELLRGTTVDMACLSQIAQLLLCILERKPLIKGSIIYPLSFTGRMAIQAITDILGQYAHTSAQFGAEIPEANAHYMAMSIARSLKTQLFIHEADWEDHPLSAGVDEVYMFFSDCANNDKVDGAAANAREIHGTLFERRSLDAVGLSAQAAAACVSTQTHDLPTGVFAPMTRCYSPTCALNTSPRFTCYVPSCPRAGRAWNASDLDVADAVDDDDVGDVGAKAWVELVPPELVQSLPRKEVERQNALHEMVQKEESFLRDLQLIDTFVHRLRALAGSSGVGMARAAPLSGAALETFIEVVFGNYLELTTHIAAFVDRLCEREREEHPMVQTIGDLCVNAALEWGSAYATYVQHYPVALYTLKREIATNARMAKFADDCRRDPQAHRHPLDNFLFRPPARLQRYHLHLESILKYTDPMSPDQEQILLATEIIDEQCKVAQAGVEAAEQRLQVQELAGVLEAKRPDIFVPLNLHLPDRKLVHQGTVYRRPDSFEFEWTEMTAMLFDNYFVLAKRKRPVDAPPDATIEPSKMRLVYSKPPIPVALLDWSGFHDPSLSRGHLNRRLMPGDMTDMFPFSVRHRASREAFTLYVATAQQRAEWHQSLTAVERMVAAHDAKHAVIRRTPLSGDTFAAGALQPDGLPRDVPNVHPEVTCAAPFRLEDHTQMLAVGTSDGVWIGLYGQVHSFHKVLHLRGVTQCTVLERFGHFLVLADKSLIAYDLQALVPSKATPLSFAPQKLSGNRDVLFFATGYVGGRELLVYAKKKTSETSIRVLEPIEAGPDSDGRRFLSRRPSETFSRFREYKKFYVGYEATGVQFLQTAIAVYTHRGFQTYSLETEALELLPTAKSATRDDTRAWSLLKQLEGQRPLGIFHLPDQHYLLCFDRCACYTDAAGRLVRTDAAFEWQGRPLRIACTADTILAFSSTFVEVHRLTGELLQVIPGSDIRLLSRPDNAQLSARPVLMVEQVPSAALHAQVQLVSELRRAD